MSIVTRKLFSCIRGKQRHISAAWLADQHICFHYLECTTLLPESTGNTQEEVAPSDMTEQWLTGTLSLNTNKQTKTNN